MSFIISLENPLRERVSFAIRHLVTTKQGKQRIKPTDGALTDQEGEVFAKICHNIRICQLRHSLSGFLAFLNFNNQDLVKEGSSALEVKTELCVSVLESARLDGNDDVQGVSDEIIESYVLKTGDLTTVNEDLDLSIVKEKALKHAKLCLVEGSLDIYPSKFLNTIINYACYTEQISKDELQCTIIWKDHRFTSKGRKLMNILKFKLDCSFQRPYHIQVKFNPCTKKIIDPRIDAFLKNLT